MVITGKTNGSPDMILTAFDVKFDEKKDGMPPEACRPLKKLKKNNVEKVGLQTVKQKQCRYRGFPARPPERGFGGRSPPGRGKRGFAYGINCWNYIT